MVSGVEKSVPLGTQLNLQHLENNGNIRLSNVQQHKKRKYDASQSISNIQENSNYEGEDCDNIQFTLYDIKKLQIIFFAKFLQICRPI